MQLHHILTELTAIAAQHDPHFPASLQTGLSRADLQAELDAAGFVHRPPQEWFALYGWHNGSVQPDKQPFDTPLFHYHCFLPVEAALAEWARRMETNRHHEPDFPVFEPQLLPVFEFEGEFYCIECGDTEQPRAPVWFDFHGSILCYDSLHAMLEAKLECHQTEGIYVRDADGWEDCADEAACAAVLLKHNPCRKQELWNCAHP